MKRRYELKKRAQRQEETRRRIVEAAVGLHTSVGPAKTSLSAIADAAGVQRHTVYSHFPDDKALFRACSLHWREGHPFPDPAGWTGIADPEARLRQALLELYAWYESVERDFALFARDSDRYPEVWAERQEQIRKLADALCAPFGRRRAIRAAVGHAVEFETWRSLVRRQGLSARQAADAMVRLVLAV